MLVPIDVASNKILLLLLSSLLISIAHFVLYYKVKNPFIGFFTEILHYKNKTTNILHGKNYLPKCLYERKLFLARRTSKVVFAKKKSFLARTTSITCSSILNIKKCYFLSYPKYKIQLTFLTSELGGVYLTSNYLIIFMQLNQN